MRIDRKWFAYALVFGLAAGVGACDGDDDPITPDPLLAPTGLAAVSTATGVEVSWNAVTGAQSYTLERKPAGAGDFAALQTGITATTYTDAAVQPGSTYDYRVRAVRGPSTSPSSDVVRVDIASDDPPVAAISGDIAASRRLDADTLYVLRGRVRVLAGATLTIEAGTRILGDAAVVPTFLVVERGARIVAEGTAASPIVFTSSKPAGSRARGDWGGIVINGRSYCNLAADNQCESEGGGGFFGGDDPDDSSGVLRYVRIEYVGYEVSLGNELNGLTLNGVGRGTEIDYVQVHQGLDDGIEWFGGTVDVKHAIVTGASDDSFDYSSGWQGRGQFWIAVQDPDDADQGFEVDNNETDNDASPMTSPTLYNVTLVGKGPGRGTAGESTRGLLYRRGAAGILRNFIVLGFEVGLDIDNGATYTRCTEGTPAPFTLSNAIFSENGVFLDGDGDDETVCLTRPAWTAIRQEAPGLGDTYVWPDLSQLDLQPSSGAAATQNAATPPSDGFFDPSATYLGAVAPSGRPWYEGWITTDVN